MSGVLKSVGKVFKKVGKAVGKILPAVLAVGATVFTAGAALGLPAMAGGWGGAVSSVFGGGSTIGNMLTGAVTQAGYGAALGGAASMIGGGSFSDGAAAGAAAGAVGGGLMAGMGGGTDLLAGKVGQSTANRFDTAWSTAAGGGQGNMTPDAVGQFAAGKGLTAPTPTPTVAGASMPAPAAAGGNGLMSFLKDNQAVVGQTLSGLGSGLMQGLAAKDAAAAREKEQQRVTDSYGVDPNTLAGLGSSPQTTTGAPTPAEAYSRRDASAPKSGKGRYKFNPTSGTIEWVQTA